MMIKHFSDLKIYQIAAQLSQEINELVRRIPCRWQIKEVRQILSSSNSAPSNIAEGFGRRFYPKEFIRYLAVALGSSDETQNHLILLHKKNHISQAIHNHYLNRWKNLSVRILNFMNYLQKRHKISL